MRNVKISEPIVQAITLADTNADSLDKTLDNQVDEDSSNESYSQYSSFEDDADDGPSIEDALKKNFELMNKSNCVPGLNVNGKGLKTIIYDSNARIIK